MNADGVRIDRWLWAARFFKTRRLAVDAINGGKVEINGAGAKPSKTVRVGDEVRVRKDAFLFQVIVLALAEQRGSADVAQTLYEETEDSARRREALRQQLRAQSAAFPRPQGRPEKHARKALTKFKRGSGE
ncbi:MAG: S4 domain-containing protein [Aquisalimonadaceae bacterium]